MQIQEHFNSSNLETLYLFDGKSSEFCVKPNNRTGTCWPLAENTKTYHYTVTVLSKYYGIFNSIFVTE